MAEVKSEVVIRVRELVVGFDGTTVLDHMSLDVFRGEIWASLAGRERGNRY
jgi:ABC-type transporter Mla maintaining outer membrane lipid asymmetry ATPase subunit MlaF